MTAGAVRSDARSLWSLEMDLLLYSIRPDRARASSLSPLETLRPGEVDWERLLELAVAHGVVSLLYRALAEYPECVPADILEWLRSYHRRNKLCNVLLAGELTEVLELLDSRGIPALPYKGPVLATTVYGEVGLRKSGDLDILIPRQSLPQASEVLLARGYEPEPRLDAAQERAYLRFERERRFVNYERRQVIELQWELLPPQFAFDLPVRRFRERARRSRVGGSAVDSLSPEHLILVLCVHGTKHFWERLQWVCDVAWTLESYSEELDWDLLFREAAARGGRRMLLLGLYLAHDLLGAPPPRAELASLRRDPEVETLASEVYGWMFDDAPDSRSLLEDSAFFPFHYRVRERLRDRLRYVSRTVFTPNYADWRDLPLPRPLFFVYYALKPLRLAKKYGERWLAARGG